ncbi:SEA domain-containing protein [Caerostris darwini]|uniref:SEA domain-containing protein n=1 Tax=Caerostris darwini TaxID=1538125 RepID=A0AAV4TJ86_9ARAC|nr:SEA domain-containing protein [Caerostris darwini]
MKNKNEISSFLGTFLLASGEPTVAATAEEEIAFSPSTSSILMAADSSSSGLDSDSVHPRTEGIPKETKKASTVFEDESSETPETSGSNKSSSTEDVSTEIFTELLNTRSSVGVSDSSELTSFANANLDENERQQDPTTFSGDNLGKGTESGDLLDAEETVKMDDSEKTSILSSEVSESSTRLNELTTNFTEVDTKSTNGKAEGMDSLSAEESTAGNSEESTGKDLLSKTTLMESFDSSTTNVEMMNTGLKNSPSTSVSNTQTSKENSADSSFPAEDTTQYIDDYALNSIKETEVVKTVATSEDSEPHNLLSLQNTTPKSATKKRSLNSTNDSKAYDGTTLASISASNQPEITTLVGHNGPPVSDSLHDILSTGSSAIHAERLILQGSSDQIEVLKSSTEIHASNTDSPMMSVSSNVEREKNPLESIENIPKKDSDTEIATDQPHTGNTNAQTTSDSMKTVLYSEVPMSTPKVSEDSNSLNNLHDSYPGVTFDPNGMKNDNPQDPDSVVFYIPSVSTNKASTHEDISYSTEFATDNTKPESETEAFFVMNKNSNDGNGAVQFERMQEDKSTETPKPSHQPMVSTEVMSSSNDNPPSLPPGFVFWDPSKTGWILPANFTETNKKDSEVDNESEEMLQDSPHFKEVEHTQNIPMGSSSDLKITEKEGDVKTTHLPISSQGRGGLIIDSGIETVTEIGMIELSSFVSHTDQSVIRPVRVRPTSPEDKPVSTSILPDSSSTQSSQQPTVLKLSEPTTGSSMAGSEKIGTSPADTSSPIILPNPAPSVTEVVTDPELSTIVMQPELVPLSLDKKVPDVSGSSNSTSAANSTIAGIAVKTSVSVSLPLSMTKNENQTFQPSLEELLKNVSILPVSFNRPLSTALKNEQTNAPTADVSSSDGSTSTSVQTTTASSFRILKPKLKIPGGSDSAFTPRPARPFVPSLKKPTTTAGPPVSIFKKTRTRIASITSSTTARPLRKFSPMIIKYASDFPGIEPELIIATDPTMPPTTTPAPTTTEEPISEVPFTDPTHMPTLVSEDDVTLVKVAGYIVIDRGLRWNDLLHNRHSPEYKRHADMMHLYLERMFRSSPIASRLWKIEIDGFSGNKSTRPVAIDFFLYLIKTRQNIATEHLATVFHEKLSTNNTFGTFRVDPSKTAFEMIQEEPLKQTTPAPEEETVEPPIPQWAIACIVIGAASLIFIVLFAAVTMYGRHHMRRRYSSKLSEEDSAERSSGEWESKMAAAYENMAADTLYDADDLHADTYKKNRIATFHGIPSTLQRCDSWSSDGRTAPSRKKRPH